MRKKTFKKVLACLFAAALFAQTIGLGAVPVKAADPAGVTREGNARTWQGTADGGAHIWAEGKENDFLKNAPFGTVVLETEMMTLQTPDYDASRVTFVAYDSNFVFGSRMNSNGSETNAIVYTPKIEANATARSADGFALIFKDAATLQDGQKRDVKVTYYNIEMTVDRATVAGNHSFPVTTGRWLTVAPFNPTLKNGAPEKNSEGNYSLGRGAMQVDVRIEVLNAPEGATTLFSTVDLDVKAGDWCGAKYHESFQVLYGALSNVYVPTTNYLTITRPDGAGTLGNGVKLAAAHNFNVKTANGIVTDGIKNKNYWADESTYNSGFAVLGDASGFSVRWWGAGNGMGSQLYSSNIKHWIMTKSSAGGNITTVVDGEKFPKNTKETAMDVPDHNDATYMLEPEEGYVPGKLILDGVETDITGITGPTTIPAPNGGEVSITPNGDGTYTVVFLDNTKNHTLNIIWAKDVSLTKVWDDQNKAHSMDEVASLFKIYANGDLLDITPVVEPHPSDASRFTVRFENLLVCDNNFNLYEYTISESVPEGYDPVDDLIFTLDSNPQNPFDVGTVENKKTPQTAVIQFVDVDGEGTVTTENGEEEGTLLETSDPQSGPDNTPIKYDPSDVIKTYTDKGYEVELNPMDGKPNYDDDLSVDQLFTVKLKHVVETITPDDPKTPDDPMNPDGTPYPDGLTKEDLTKTVTRTIHYRYFTEDGEEAYADVVQTVTFTRTATVDHVTGEVTYSDWSTAQDSFDAVESPDLTGFYPDKESVPALTGITPESEDVEEVVIYNQKEYYVTYIDPATGRTILEKTYQPVGDPEPKAPADPTRNGYRFDGWDKEVDKDGNVTYKAKWVKEYYVTYIDPATGRTIMDKTFQPVGDPEPKAPADPTRDGYEFTGWEKSTDADGNITYKATWKEANKNAKTGDRDLLPLVTVFGTTLAAASALLLLKKRREN